MIRKSLHIRMDETLYENLKTASRGNGKSMNSIVNKALNLVFAPPNVPDPPGDIDFSNLAELLDIPRETVVRLAKYLVDYVEFKESEGLYQELGKLARFILENQKVLNSTNINGITENDIPETSNQLEEILEATEEATNQILTSTEVLLDTLDALKKEISASNATIVNGEAKELIEKFISNTQSELMKIFSACNFQDLTGQRIQKIVSLIKDIEEKILDLIVRYDLRRKEAESGMPPQSRLGAEIPPSIQPLQGPKRKGEAFSQNDIDSLLSDLGF